MDDKHFHLHYDKNDAIILEGHYYVVREVLCEKMDVASYYYLLFDIHERRIVREGHKYVHKYGRPADNETIKLYRVLFAD